MSGFEDAAVRGARRAVAESPVSPARSGSGVVCADDSPHHQPLDADVGRLDGDWPVTLVRGLGRELDSTVVELTVAPEEDFAAHARQHHASVHAVGVGGLSNRDAVAFAGLPRAELLHTVDDAKRRVDALLDGLVPAAGKLSSDATRWYEDLRDKVEPGGREVLASDDAEPRVAERPVVQVLRRNVSGRARILDGDTLELGKTRVRLHGIDAPESRQSCVVDGHRWACGEKATRALTERIGSRTVGCEERARDRYGRSVAVCRVAGEDLNAWMVRQGWALAYRRYSRAYVGAEGTARAAKRGIWRGQFVAPWEWRRGVRLAGSRPASTEPPGGRCRVMGNIGRDGSRIYHVPGGQFHNRTRIDTERGERWFCSEAEARTAGWRRSRR